jgi:hypothetical protein
MACGLRCNREPVSLPVTAPLSTRLRQLVCVALAIAAAGTVLGFIVRADVGSVEPIAAPSRGTTAEPDVEPLPVDPAWSIATSPVQRIGYRLGQKQAIEVVPLGPSAVEVELGTARAFLAMRMAATAAGVDLRLESGFRTAAQQRALYKAWRKGRGNKAAPPGRSNHQSGRALDIAVSAPGALAWLETNAASYGFARTVVNEPWHWEYVDAPIARGATKPLSPKAAKLARLAKAKAKAKAARAKLAKAGHARRPNHRPGTAPVAHPTGRRVATR